MIEHDSFFFSPDETSNLFSVVYPEGSLVAGKPGGSLTDWIPLTLTLVTLDFAGPSAIIS